MDMLYIYDGSVGETLFCLMGQNCKEYKKNPAQENKPRSGQV